MVKKIPLYSALFKNEVLHTTLTFEHSFCLQLALSLRHIKTKTWFNSKLKYVTNENTQISYGFITAYEQGSSIHVHEWSQCISKNVLSVN